MPPKAKTWGASLPAPVFPAAASTNWAKLCRASSFIMVTPPFPSLWQVLNLTIVRSGAIIMSHINCLSAKSFVSAHRRTGNRSSQARPHGISPTSVCQGVNGGNRQIALFGNRVDGWHISS